MTPSIRCRVHVLPEFGNENIPIAGRVLLIENLVEKLAHCESPDHGNEVL